MRLNKGSTNTAQPQYPMLTQYFLEKMRERKRKWAFFQLCHSLVSSLSLGLEFGKAFDLFIRIYNFCIIFSSRSLLFVLCIVNLAWFVKIQVGFCFMWSGFDLIGLGYVYLQPWFDFFFNHNSWFECYDFWCNLLYCDCFNIDSSFGFWFCAFIVFMVLW